MKLSVIVPTYNRPSALVKVLDGLLAQSRLPDEIIIADDGSDILTREAVRPYLSNTKIRVSHIWQEDKGFRAARIRNRAVKASGGDYLVFLDGDCIPHRHFINDHERLARKGYFFQGKRVIVSKKASPGFSFTDTDSALRLIRHLVLFRISNGHHIVRLPFFPSQITSKLSGIRSCNMGVFRQDIMAVNGFNQAFTGWGREDSELAVRLYKYGLKRKEHPFMAICYHLWHQENSRDNIEKNDALLNQTLAGEKYYCEFGIENNPGQPDKDSL